MIGQATPADGEQEQTFTQRSVSRGLWPVFFELSCRAAVKSSMHRRAGTGAASPASFRCVAYA